MIQERACRVCKTPLASVFDLGTLALSSFPVGAGTLPEAPLDLCRCPVCGLVQLRHTVSPDALFRQYWYQSSVNETMRAELAHVVSDGIEHLGGLNDGDIVVDVGANDGTLLASYPTSVRRVAYEPALNLQAALQQHCNVQYAEYFPGMHLPEADSVSLLTSIACFYAVDDPMLFMRAVDDALLERGLWIVQFQDLHQLLEATAFDDICHEHLFYPGLAAIERLLETFDLCVVDAERRAVNGGSLRLTVGRRWRTVSPRVAEFRAIEAGCEGLEALGAFARQAYGIRSKVRMHLQAKARHRQAVDLYGASTKGNTLLQFCGIGPKEIRQAWERSPEKWGRRTVTGIPIVSEADGRKNPPAMLFVGIWQFRNAIVRREAEYLKGGGQLLFPLPHVETVMHGGSDVYESVSAHTDAAPAR